MSLYIKKFISKFKKEDKGSFTLEATLVFPLIFVVTIALILLSLVIYEKVVVYQKAYIIAERVAHTWDNSKKDFDTGAFDKSEYTTKKNMDGLYWRSNHVGQEFIQKIFDTPDIGGISGKKIEKAKTKAIDMIPGAVKSITINDTLGFNQTVEVTLEVRLKVPEFVAFITSSDFEVTASASIKDPVEIIRTTDFIYHYGNEVIQGLSN